jgi:hypothetical protein
MMEILRRIVQLLEMIVELLKREVKLRAVNEHTLLPVRQAALVLGVDEEWLADEMDPLEKKQEVALRYMLWGKGETRQKRTTLCWIREWQEANEVTGANERRTERLLHGTPRNSEKLIDSGGSVRYRARRSGAR